MAETENGGPPPRPAKVDCTQCGRRRLADEVDERGRCVPCIVLRSGR